MISQSLLDASYALYSNSMLLVLKCELYYHRAPSNRPSRQGYHLKEACFTVHTYPIPGGIMWHNNDYMDSYSVAPPPFIVGVLQVVSLISEASVWVTVLTDGLINVDILGPHKELLKVTKPVCLTD